MSPNESPSVTRTSGDGTLDSDIPIPDAIKGSLGSPSLPLAEEVLGCLHRPPAFEAQEVFSSSPADGNRCSVTGARRMTKDGEIVRLGKYEIGRTLGEGNFGKVKHARRIDSGQSYAVKILERKRVIDLKIRDQVSYGPFPGINFVHFLLSLLVLSGNSGCECGRLREKLVR